MFVMLFALLLLINTFGNENSSVSSRVLVSSSAHLLDVPSFGFYGDAQCDKDGDLFFHSNSASYSQATILKLTSGSWEPISFTISPDLLSDTGFEDFSVDPSGQVWLLGAARAGGHYIYAFTSDGKMSGRTKLDVPDQVNIEDFAVSDRGTALVAGYFESSADEALRGKPYVGLFDHSGRLLSRLNEAFDTIDLETIRETIHGGNAIFADDGYIYLLHQKRVLVLSESGKVVRRINFDKPKDAIATKIAVSGGLAAVWLSKLSKEHQITQRFFVFNAQTGEPFAIYTPSPELGSNALCFSRKEGFEFYSVDSGRVRLIQAALR